MPDKEQPQAMAQASMYQQQLQGIASQKEALNMQLMEISSALDEMEKASGKEVYKIAGPLIIKSAKADVKKDMDDRKELIHNRLKILEKSEKRMQERMEELRDKLSGKAG